MTGTACGIFIHSDPGVGSTPAGASATLGAFLGSTLGGQGWRDISDDLSRRESVEGVCSKLLGEKVDSAFKPILEKVFVSDTGEAVLTFATGSVFLVGTTLADVMGLLSRVSEVISHSGRSFQLRYQSFVYRSGTKKLIRILVSVGGDFVLIAVYLSFFGPLIGLIVGSITAAVTGLVNHFCSEE